MPASAGRPGRLDVNGARPRNRDRKAPEAWLMRVEANGHGIVTTIASTAKSAPTNFC